MTARTIIDALLVLLLSAGMISCAKKKPKTGAVLALLSLPACAAVTGPAPVNNEFSGPAKVTINGYTGDAMEPFISRDGSGVLFFNSLNDGNDTSLYWATKVNETTFTNKGKLSAVNGTPPHLDAVASMDLSNNFYYTTTREYFTTYRTIYTGTYAAGSVTGLRALDGDFYIRSPGWLIMDVEVSPDGQKIYYSSAHFSGGSVPDQSDLGVANYSGGNFNRDPNGAAIMAAVNTCDCLEYAPSISSSGLELFFSRIKFDAGLVEILVAKRSAATDPFGAPERIGAITGFAEAPSLTADGKTLYYHYKEDGGAFAIYKVSRP